MHLYLIRHGETVDNVAGLYAGSRDSQLTNHGVEQTKRLGRHFASNNIHFTHIFASPLSRAFRTAQAIRACQGEAAAEVVKKEELVERDFGSFEGKPFSARPHGEEDDVETKESMARRIDVFLDRDLFPVLDTESGQSDNELVVAVVAHGMLLSNFWRRLLLRLPKNSLKVADEVTAKRGGVVLEYIGGWSNTGYMELSFRRASAPDSDKPPTEPPSEVEDVGEAVENETTLKTPVPPTVDPKEAAVAVVSNRDDPSPINSSPRVLSGWSTTILAIDSTVHLLGLKRQRGGIGSLAHDEGQKKLDSFFKKPRMS